MPSAPHECSPGTATACNLEILSTSIGGSEGDEDELLLDVVVVHGAIISPGTATASSFAMLSSTIIGWAREWLM